MTPSPNVVLVHTCIDVPAEIYTAAETLHIFFAKEGHQEWQLLDVAARSVITKLVQEKRELWHACVAFRTALKDLDNALMDCLEIPANVLPAWYAAGLLLEEEPKQ